MKIDPGGYIMSDKSGIQIYVSLKNAGTAGKKVKEYPFCLGKIPRTLRELVEESVRASVHAYTKRSDASLFPSPLTDEQLDGMYNIGKIAFGIQYNKKAIDESKAVNTAIEAVKDGIVRIFKGSSEITDLDDDIEIAEGDIFTFVRLTMLSGRMW